MAAHRYFIPRCFRHFLAALPPGRAEARRARAAAHRVSRRLRAAAGAGVRRTRIDSVVVGALGRETAMAPLSQVELLYCLPPALRRAPGADPAPILAEIAAMLEGLSPDAAASADGTAVLVATGGRRVRVIPAIETGDGAFAVPGPGGDGWVELSPLAEAIRLRAVDQATGRKATHLILMAEAWRRHTGAPIEPHALELLATEFVSRWAYRYGDRFFYDWMARDFFGWLATQGGRALALPGCGRCIAAGRAWVFHAARAHGAARRACADEQGRRYRAAAASWRAVFGVRFPRPSTVWLLMAALRDLASLERAAISRWHAGRRPAAGEDWAEPVHPTPASPHKAQVPPTRGGVPRLAVISGGRDR